MQLVDAGMVAFAAWHALKGRVVRPLTFQVARSLRKRIMEGRVRGTTVRAGDVERILGVPPDLVPDFLALAGDRVDGIPRVLGDKPAARILRTHGPIRAWIDRRPASTAELVYQRCSERRRQILLNLRLTELRATGAPPAPLLGDGWCDLERAARLAREAGHARLAAEIDGYQLLADWGRRTVVELAEAGLVDSRRGAS